MSASVTKTKEKPIQSGENNAAGASPPPRQPPAPAAAAAVAKSTSQRPSMMSAVSAPSPSQTPRPSVTKLSAKEEEALNKKKKKEEEKMEKKRKKEEEKEKKKAEKEKKKEEKEKLSHTASKQHSEVKTPLSSGVPKSAATPENGNTATSNSNNNNKKNAKDTSNALPASAPAALAAKQNTATPAPPAPNKSTTTTVKKSVSPPALAPSDMTADAAAPEATTGVASASAFTAATTATPDELSPSQAQSAHHRVSRSATPPAPQFDGVQKPRPPEEIEKAIEDAERQLAEMKKKKKGEEEHNAPPVVIATRVGATAMETIRHHHHHHDTHEQPAPAPAAAAASDSHPDGQQRETFTGRAEKNNTTGTQEVVSADEDHHSNTNEADKGSPLYEEIVHNLLKDFFQNSQKRNPQITVAPSLEKSSVCDFYVVLKKTKIIQSCLAKIVRVLLDAVVLSDEEEIKCFCLEVVPLSSSSVSIHITVGYNEAHGDDNNSSRSTTKQKFYQHYINCFNAPFAVSGDNNNNMVIDMPFPAREKDLCDAQRKQIEYSVIRFLLFQSNNNNSGEDKSSKGSKYFSDEEEEQIELFPAHTDAIRDHIWNVQKKFSPASFFFSASRHRPHSHLNEKHNPDEEGESIAQYFGLETGFYFSWMSYYRSFLFFLSLVSALYYVFVYLYSTPSLSTAVTAANNKNNKNYSKSDNDGADALLHIRAGFVLVMIMSSVVFVKLWERRCYVFMMENKMFYPLQLMLSALQQGVHHGAGAADSDDALLLLMASAGSGGNISDNAEALGERRGQFRGTLMPHPILKDQAADTQREVDGHDNQAKRKPRMTVQYPAWRRAFLWQPLSFVVISFFVGVVIFLMLCFLNLEGLVVDQRRRRYDENANGWFHIARLHRYSQPGQLLNKAEHPYLFFAPKLFYSVTVTISSSLFQQLARTLTNLENYEFRGQHIRALTQKRIVFEFLNSYAKLFFIAFVRRDLKELYDALAFIFYFSALVRLTSATVLPFFLTHRKRFFSRKGEKRTDGRAITRADYYDGNQSALDELDENLSPYEVYTDVVEMLIQFGFILFFLPIFPLAIILSYFSNYVEVMSDCFKLCYVVRRPVPRRGVSENKTYNAILKIFILLALITNTYLLVFQFYDQRPPTATTTRSVHLPHSVANASMDFLKSNNTLNIITNINKSNDKTALLLQQIRLLTSLVQATLIEHVGLALSLFLFYRIPSVPYEVQLYQAKALYRRQQQQQQQK